MGELRARLLYAYVVGFVGMVLVAVGNGGVQAWGVFMMLWGNNIIVKVVTELDESRRTGDE